MADHGDGHEPRIARIRENLVDSLGPFDLMADLIARSQHGPNTAALFGVVQSPHLGFPRTARSLPTAPDVVTTPPTATQLLQSMQTIVDTPPLSTIETNLPFKKMQEKRIAMESKPVSQTVSPSTSSETTEEERRKRGVAPRVRDEEHRKKRKRKRSEDRSDVDERDNENRDWQKPCSSGLAVKQLENSDDTRMTINDLFGDEKKTGSSMGEKTGKQPRDADRARKEERRSGGGSGSGGAPSWKKEEGESPDSGFLDEAADSDREHQPPQIDAERLFVDVTQLGTLLSPPRKPAVRLPALVRDGRAPSLKCVIDLSILQPSDRQRISNVLHSVEQATVPPPKAPLSPPPRPTSKCVTDCAPSSYKVESPRIVLKDARPSSSITLKLPKRKTSRSPSLRRDNQKKESGSEATSPSPLQRQKETFGDPKERNGERFSSKKVIKQEGVPSSSSCASPVPPLKEKTKERSAKESSAVASESETFSSGRDHQSGKPWTKVKRKELKTREEGERKREKEKLRDELERVREEKEREEKEKERERLAQEERLRLKEEERLREEREKAAREEEERIRVEKEKERERLREEKERERLREEREREERERKLKEEAEQRAREEEERLRAEKEREEQARLQAEREREEKEKERERQQREKEKEQRAKEEREKAKQREEKERARLERESERALREEKEKERLREKEKSRERQKEKDKEKAIVNKGDKKERSLKVKEEEIRSGKEKRDPSIQSGSASSRKDQRRTSTFTCLCNRSGGTRKKVEFERNEDRTFKSFSFYQTDFARPKKHRADAELSDKLLRVLYYLESVAYFILSAAIQLPPYSESQTPDHQYHLIRETAELLKSTTNTFLQAVPHLPPVMQHYSDRVKMLSWRAQAVLYFHMFSSRNTQALKNYSLLAKFEPHSAELEAAAQRGESLSAGGSQSARSAATPSPASSTHSANNDRAKEITVPLSFYRTQRAQLSILHNLMWGFRVWNDANAVAGKGKLERELSSQLESACSHLSMESNLVNLSEYLATGAVWMTADYEAERAAEQARP